MKAEFINPFLTAILNVLTTMARMEAKAGKPLVKENQAAKGDVTGLIGMTGTQAKGTLAISFTQPVIEEITRRMLGEEDATNAEMLADMAGEITNMVTGGAKRILSEKGYEFAMAIPSIVSGKGHTIRHQSKKPIVMIPFTTDAGDFFIEICFEE